MPLIDIVVPYNNANATVRTRAVRWVERYADQTGLALAEVANISGPGFSGSVGHTAGPLLLCRNAARFSRGRTEQRLLRSAQPGVYDLDDGLPWDDGRLPGLGRWWKRPWPRSLIARRAASSADRVTVGNEVLADWAAQHCDDVRIVPTCVEPDDYDPKLHYDVGDVPVLGWIGSPATEPYLVDIAQSLAELHRRHGAIVEIVSAPGALPAALAPFARRVDWSLEVASKVGAKWDVGLMPLRDGVYERAKCGYKLLQYAAAGLPAVASPVGVNRRMIDSFGIPAPTQADDWVEAVTQLIELPAGDRREIGDRGRRLANQYSYSTWEPTWRSALDVAQPAG